MGEVRSVARCRYLWNSTVGKAGQLCLKKSFEDQLGCFRSLHDGAIISKLLLHTIKSAFLFNSPPELVPVLRPHLEA
ncbi:hypothetical protein KC344_g152 [Hortaea werneckii]|nr:hypothetical protein KC344_g152 [Hortaea werneckii]